MKRLKIYSVGELFRQMADQGLPASRMWLRTVEAKGLLTSPRRPNSRRDRYYTQDQIDQIIDAFSPGGEGECLLV